VQSTKRCCASTRVCSENRKQDTNVLDGADFVRDVRNIYLERPVSDYGVNNLDGADFRRRCWIIPNSHMRSNIHLFAIAPKQNGPGSISGHFASIVFSKSETSSYHRHPVRRA